MTRSWWLGLLLSVGIVVWGAVALVCLAYLVVAWGGVLLRWWRGRWLPVSSELVAASGVVGGAFAAAATLVALCALARGAL